MRHLKTFESADRLYSPIERAKWIRLSPKIDITHGSPIDDRKVPFWSDGLSKNIIVTPVALNAQNEAVSPTLGMRYYELLTEAINTGLGLEKSMHPSKIKPKGPGGPDRIDIVFGKEHDTNRTAYFTRLVAPTTEQVSGLITNSNIEVYRILINSKKLFAIVYFIVDDWVMLRVRAESTSSDTPQLIDRLFRCDGITGVKQCLEDLKTTITQ
jgi:hypothetical protein